jgi:signal transduction histidine kinase
MLDRQKLQHKMLFIALLALLPSFLLLYLLLEEKNIAIDSSKSELAGNGHLRPLNQFHRSVSEYRSRVAAKAELPPSREAANAAIKKLQVVGSELGEKLSSREITNHIATQWDYVLKAEATPIAFQDGVAKLRQQIHAAFRLVGDESSLVLDPDLDSYYVMDVILVKLPALQDQLNSVELAVEKAFADSISISRNFSRLAVEMEKLRATIEELNRSLESAYKSNEAQSLTSALNELAGKTIAGIESYLQYVEKAILPLEASWLNDDSSLPLIGSDMARDLPSEHAALMSQARSAGYELWDAASNQLDVLVNARIERLQDRKWQAVIIVFGILLVIIGVVYWIANRLRARVDQLAVFSRALARQPDRVDPEGIYRLKHLATGDEIGGLAQSVMTMAEQIGNYIREIQQSKMALELYNQSLEYRVAERTQEIADKNAELEGLLKQIKEAQRRLVTQEKMASLGALTAGIAHEIKNPLNFVNNFAELSSELTDELKESIDKLEIPDADRDDLIDIIGMLHQNVKKIEEHGRRADGIVKGMLAHSHGKAGEMQPVMLNDLLTEYAKLAYHGLRAQDQSFNVTLDFLLDPAIQRVSAVGQDLSRAILNTVNNACYSANQKKKAIGDSFAPTVTIMSKDLGEKVEIRIRDNGMGIPKEKLTQIFEPFYTTKPTGQGTGLGLSMTFDIIAQVHHGEIHAESVEGEFAEFVFTLPKSHKESAA